MNTSKTFSNTMPWTNTQVRNGDFPLERYSIFENLDEAKKYAAGISPYIGLAYEGQLIAVTNSGEQQLYVLDSALSSSEMSGLRRIANYGELSTAQSSLISTINEVSTTICTKLSTDQVLIRDHLSFGYDNDLKTISLSIADISGNVYSSSIKTAQFADDFVLSCARIETHDSQNYIVIYWITEDSSESKTEIPLSAVSQVYKAGYGISVASEPTTDLDGAGLSYKISIANDIANQTNIVYLSNAISSKVYTGTIANGEQIGNYSNLSVVKITKEEYEQKITDAACSGVDLSNNVLYIVSSDYIDAYEQRIENVVMSNDNIPSEATNKHYVDSISSNLANNINQLSTTLSNDYALTSTLSGISAELSNSISSKIHYDNLITNESADINLSIVKLSPEQFEQQVLNNQLNDHTLYVLSANHLDAFGKTIKNITMTNDSIPSEAASQHFVENYVSAASNKLTNDMESFVDELSVAISSKVYVGNLQSGKYTDLSILKATAHEYESIVVNATAGGVDLSNNVVYIVSADGMNMYGEKISNLTMTDDSIPSEATNKHYVDGSSRNALSTMCNGILSALSAANIIGKQQSEITFANVLSGMYFLVNYISSIQNSLTA